MNRVGHFGCAAALLALALPLAGSPCGQDGQADADSRPADPIVVSAGPWAGPGHGLVVNTPAGDTWHVYHSWRAGQIGGGAGRVVLLDRVVSERGWPTMLAAPSSVSLPRP